MGLTTQTFDIVTRIAIGNGALVYRAVEKSSLRQVALKLLTQSGEVDHQLDLDALFTGAAKLKAIYGAHVCQLLDAYSDEDGPVLVYEFASGLNGAELPLQKKLDATQALDVAAQLISALRSGERQRMPHGDLKPSNIIFSDLPDGRPFTFVLDWGLAAYRHALRDDSLYYLAPERLHGGPPSHAADLFAAGAVLFYLYTGKVLVAGGSYDQVDAAWKNVHPEVLANLRPDLSPKLVQWICALLELDPAQRPASAVEASATLAAMGPPPPVAPPESIRPRPVSAPTRFPVPIAAPSSVIVPPPKRSGSRPASGISAPVPVPRPRQRPPAPPPKSKSALPAMLLGAFTAIALGGGGWYFLRHPQKDEPKEPALAPDATPSRPPSQSVTAPVAAPPKRSRPSDKGTAAPAKSAPKGGPVKMTSPGQNPGPGPAHPAAHPAALPIDPGDAGNPIIAFDDFTYPNGADLAGQNGGNGWAGPWIGFGGKIDGQSLTYPKAPVSGGSVRFGEADGDQDWQRMVGPFNRFIGDPRKGIHWYFGALVRHHSGLPGGGGELEINPFSPEAPTSLIRIVVEDTGAKTKIALNSEKTYDINNSAEPIALIMEVELRNQRSNRFDVVAKLWVNPEFSGFVAPLVAQVECTLPNQQLPPQLGVLLRKKRGQAETVVDEVRYARHWTAITGQKTKPD